jgi:hypothetical protein
MKARIRWDAGFGAVETIIDVETIGEALKEAEAMARDQFDSNATWNAEFVEEVERGLGNGQSTEMATVANKE